MAFKNSKSAGKIQNGKQSENYYISFSVIVNADPHAI
jgi:hypothetical protein